MKNYELRQAIDLFRNNKRGDAQQILEKLVVSEPRNELAWLWLASCKNNEDEKLACLQEVIKINPQNQKARDILRKLSLEEPQARVALNENHAETPISDTLTGAETENEPYEKMYHRMVNAVLADNVEEEAPAAARTMSTEPVATTGIKRVEPVVRTVGVVPPAKDKRRFTNPYHKEKAPDKPAGPADWQAERVVDREAQQTYPVKADPVPVRQSTAPNWVLLAVIALLLIAQIWSILRINSLTSQVISTTEQLDAARMELIVVNQLLNR